MSIAMSQWKRAQEDEFEKVIKEFPKKAEHWGCAEITRVKALCHTFHRQGATSESRKEILRELKCL